MTVLTSLDTDGKVTPRQADLPESVVIAKDGEVFIYVFSRITRLTKYLIGDLEHERGSHARRSGTAGSDRKPALGVALRSNRLGRSNRQ